MNSAANKRSNIEFYVSKFLKRLLDNFFINGFSKKGKEPQLTIHRE